MSAEDLPCPPAGPGRDRAGRFAVGQRVRDRRFPASVGTVLGVGADAQGEYVTVTVLEPLTGCWVTARAAAANLERVG